jgi:hypothetical protein
MYPLHAVSSSARSGQLTDKQRSEHNDAIYERNSKPYDVSQEMYDNRFILLDQGQFRKAFSFAVSNPTYRAAVDIIQNELTRGGLHVQHGPKAKQLRAEEMDTKIPWLMHGVDLLMDYFMYGVSLWQPVTTTDPETGKSKRVIARIDPLKVNIWYYRPLSGDPLFHIREPPDLMRDGSFLPSASASSSSSAKGKGTKRKRFHDEDDQKIAFRGRELFDVQVYWKNNLDLPDPLTGQLRSRVMTLIDLHLQLEMLNQCAVEAALRASNPPLVTEHHPDAKGAHVTVDGLVPYGGSLTLGRGETDFAALDAQIQQDIMIDRAMRIKDTREITGDFMNIVHAAKMMAKGTATTAGPRIDLGAERKVAKTDKAEAPKDLYKKALMTQAETLRVLGIPEGMIMAEHTGGKQGTGNVNADRIYRQNLHALKSSILGPLKIMYKSVYKEERATATIKAAIKHKPLLLSKKAQAKAKAKTKAKSKNAMDESSDDDEDDSKEARQQRFQDAVRKETDIEFVLPAIPNLEEIRMVWAEGVLKEEFVPRYISMNLGIPMSHLHDKPKTSKLDVQTEGKSSLQKEAAKQNMAQGEKDHKHALSQNKQSAGLQAKQSGMEHKNEMASGKLSMEQEKLKMKHTELKMKAQAKSKPKASGSGKKKKKAAK